MFSQEDKVSDRHNFHANNTFFIECPNQKHFRFIWHWSLLRLDVLSVLPTGPRYIPLLVESGVIESVQEICKTRYNDVNELAQKLINTVTTFQSLAGGK